MWDEALRTTRSEGRTQERPCQWMVHTAHHQEGVIHIVPVSMRVLVRHEDDVRFLSVRVRVVERRMLLG